MAPYYAFIGRRVRKKDLVADETTLYYYNGNWQVAFSFGTRIPTSTFGESACPVDRLLTEGLSA